MYKIIGTDQREYGPVTANELRKWIAEGRANGQTLVQEEGSSWKPLSSWPEFGANAPLPPPPITFPQGDGMPAATPPASKVLPATPTTHAFAVTALVMGILSVTVGMCCCYGLPFNVLGIVFSIVALIQIRNQPDCHGGRGMAIAGLVLSVLSVLLIGVLLAIGIAFSWHDIMREFR